MNQIERTGGQYIVSFLRDISCDVYAEAHLFHIRHTFTGVVMIVSVS